MRCESYVRSYILCHWRYDPETGIVLGTKGKPIGSQTGKGYLLGTVSVEGRSVTVSLHRAAWLLQTGDWPKQALDHRNGQKADNRWANLREVTDAENNQNLQTAHKDKKSSALLGAYRCRRKWQALIRVDGKLRHLGMFDTDVAAHEAYLKAKRSLHPGNTL
jgi:hypothetical protein